ncbi:hypothetical protein Tco_0601793 [Tanacetum coccineum]
MCRQPLPPPLSPPSAKLMIMALKEYEYQSMEISKITRKPSKTGKHGHGKWKSTREAKNSKPKAGKVKKSKLLSTLGQFSVNKSKP